MCALRFAASGDTSWVTTPDAFDTWVERYADDIIIGPPVYPRAVRLIELDHLDPAGAVAVRVLFRRLWSDDGWFPARASLLEAALRAGEPITYVGPCPYCRSEITVRLRLTDGRMKCPSCGTHLAGAQPSPAEKS